MQKVSIRTFLASILVSLLSLSGGLTAQEQPLGFSVAQILVKPAAGPQVEQLFGRILCSPGLRIRSPALQLFGPAEITRLNAFGHRRAELLRRVVIPPHPPRTISRTEQGAENDRDGEHPAFHTDSIRWTGAHSTEK